MKESIPLFEMAWGKQDVKNVIDSVTRGSYWANGPYIDEFESKLEEYHNVDHAIVFNSGTTALVSVLEAAGIGEGDEVIVPSFTFISTANAVRLVGAEPKFVDIERDRYGLDPDEFEKEIGENTEAVIPVHYGGKPSQIHEIVDVAERHDLTVIEDAAEAFGAKENEDLVTTIGDAGMHSFCQNKVVTTGEGGAIVTDNDDLARRLKLIRSHGRVSDEYFDSSGGGNYVTLGSNYRMPDIIASIGAAQMERAEELIESRRKIAKIYSSYLSDLPKLSLPQDPIAGRHVYQMYTVTFESQEIRDQVQEDLSRNNIGTKIYFEPAHKSKYYQNEPSPTGEMDTTREISSRVLSLPMYPDLTKEEVEYISNTILSIIN